MDWTYEMKRSVDGTAIRQDRSWQAGPGLSLQMGSRAGGGHQGQPQALSISMGLGTGHGQGWELEWDTKLCLGVGYGTVTAYKHLKAYKHL